MAGDGLQPIVDATRCACATARRSSTDGPFAETKEVLGGYYLIDGESLDEAIEWARESRAPQTARSRSVRSWTDSRRRPHRRARPRLPRRAGALRSRSSAASSATSTSPRTRCRTPSPRRRALAARRHAARTRRLDHTHRTQLAIDRIRREQTLARKTELLARAARAPGRRGDRDSRRAARADLHLLPPGARRRTPRSR